MWAIIAAMLAGGFFGWILFDICVDYFGVKGKDHEQG